MRLLFHVVVEGGDPSPYAFVVNATNETIEECYRIEQGIYFSALEAYEHIKDKVVSIERVYCDPSEGPEEAEKFLKTIKEQHPQPHIIFKNMPLQRAGGLYYR